MSGGVFFFLLLSLAGFPLMSGFFPKVIVLEILYCCGYVYISFFLIVGSRLSLYYYLSLAYLFLVGRRNKVNIYCWGGLIKIGVLWAVGAVGMFG
jgi:NADH:ubiquinone oxidoreductase subunit 2 (subunit N)